jgi:hypothetical protein
MNQIKATTKDELTSFQFEQSSRTNSVDDPEKVLSNRPTPNYLFPLIL